MVNVKIYKFFAQIIITVFMFWTSDSGLLWGVIMLWWKMMKMLCGRCQNFAEMVGTVKGMSECQNVGVQNIFTQG